MKDKRLVALSVAVTVVVLGTVYLVTRPRDPIDLPPQKITFSLPTGVKAEVLSSDDEHGEASAQKTLATVTDGKQIELKAGSYNILTGATADYIEAQVNFDVGSKAQTVTVSPDYSQKRLQALQTVEQPAINAAITRDTPQAAKKYYSVQPGKLFKHGDWFAARLRYIGPSDEYDSDTLTLVAQKKDGAWQVVTKPPAIVISRVVYPQIPQDVADALNNP